MNRLIHKLIIVQVLFLLPLLAFSQKTVTVSGSAQVELTENQSIQEIRKHARELATIDALEKAFGRVVIQGNSTYISNLQSGEKIETNTIFNTIANTSVKGEVIEVLDEEYSNITGTTIIDGHKIPVTDIRCDIEIKAKEIKTPPVEFICFPLGCTDEKCKTTSFKNDDILYLYFSSPVKGYLSVYLDDKTDAQRLYPYSNMPEEYDGGVPVDPDKKYILFSEKPEFNYFSDKDFLTDEYQLVCNSPQDINRLFIIFSLTPVNKPFLSGVKDLEKGYQLPKSLSSEDFQKWLNKYRSIEKSNVQVSIIDITITR
jgi:hypothetical protein